MARKQLTPDMTVMDAIVTMSEGNPGAATVLARLIQTENGIIHILNLDDMNIRGSRIWIAFKDHCKENLSGFIEAIRSRDPQMVLTVNGEMARSGSTERAVTGGASAL